MNFVTFNDFLDCVYVPQSDANHRPSPDEVLESLLMMYSGESPQLNGEENVARKTVHGLKIIGAGVVRVVHRCKEARDSLSLDLTSCNLLHVPEGVLHLMRHYKVLNCKLSENYLTGLSPRFGSFFTNITNLDLSSNCISNLSKDIHLCKKLETVDISTNSFVEFPHQLLQIRALVKINASKNFIAELNSEDLKNHENLEELNLEENPITKVCHEDLRKLEMKIFLTELRAEEWDDLNI